MCCLAFLDHHEKLYSQPDLSTSQDHKLDYVIVQDAAGKKDHSGNALQSEVKDGLFFTDTIVTENPLRTGISQPIIRFQFPIIIGVHLAVSNDCISNAHT